MQKMNTFRKILEMKKEQLKSLNNTIIAQSIKQETEKALLLDLFHVKDMESFTMWVPKSVVESQKSTENGNAVEMTFSGWFFEKNAGKFLSTVQF